MINHFLEMFGYRDFITYEEYRNWKRQGQAVDKKDLPTQLLPNNVEREEAIRNVLLSNPPGMVGWRSPLAELEKAWQVIYPGQPLNSRLVNVNAKVVYELMKAENEKQEKNKKKING